MDWGAAEEAAARGNPSEQFDFAERCVRESEEEGRWARAAPWYRKAAESDHPGAQLAFGLMCQRGEGVPQDNAEGIRWLRRAALAGETSAQYHLGVTYYRASLWNLTPDELNPKHEAYKWLRLAANHGYSGAEGTCEMASLRMTHDEVAAANRASEDFIPAKQPQ